MASLLSKKYATGSTKNGQFELFIHKASFAIFVALKNTVLLL